VVFNTGHVFLKLKNSLGIDKAIGFTFIARLIQALGSIGNLFLISLFLTKEEQGYFYTFTSLVAVQVFFELGLNSIIIQYTAHEVAHLKYTKEDFFFGSDIHLSRLSSMLHFCIKVFSILSIILLIILNIIGYIFFNHYSLANTVVNWSSPWILLTLSTSLLLFINPILGFLQGLGRVKETSKILLYQQIITLVTTSIVLVCKGGLWTLGIANLLSVIFVMSYLFFSENLIILKNIYNKINIWRIEYKKEILPYQYKIALSWISGYLIFQLFNPVIFAYDGPIIAGKMGLTIAAFNGISVLGMSWISTKVPLFSSLIALKNNQLLDDTFKKSLSQLLVITFILIISFLLFVILLNVLNIQLVSRFLPFTYLCLFAIITLVNQLIFSWATYLRCHKQEPYLINSIVGGLLTATSTLLFGKYFGYKGIVMGYFVLTVFLGLPWAYKTYLSKKHEWYS
jgi:O-antigen/teichoic acid export membrane protein